MSEYELVNQLLFKVIEVMRTNIIFYDHTGQASARSFGKSSGMGGIPLRAWSHVEGEQDSERGI